MILEMFFHGFVQDVTVIPMTISYERITEEQLYAFELLGIPKPKESLRVSEHFRWVLVSVCILQFIVGMLLHVFLLCFEIFARTLIYM